MRRQVAGGVAGVVPCGTTGEAVTLDPDEHERVVAVTVEEARGARRAIRVVAGCGSNDTRKSQKLAERCRKAGADALLVVTPYYNKPTPRGLLEHFKAVADAGHLPVVAYNVPGRTGVNMLPETVLALAEDPRMCAVKEASGKPRPGVRDPAAPAGGLLRPLGRGLARAPDDRVRRRRRDRGRLERGARAPGRARRGRPHGRAGRGGAAPGEALPAHAGELPRVEPDPGEVGAPPARPDPRRPAPPLVPLSKALHKPMEEALKEAGLLDEAGNPVEEAP